MALPRIGTRDEWLAERLDLLAAEKDLTRQRDILNARRRALPMVEVATDYAFEGPQGSVSLLDIFEGRRQLIVYHFMFDPSWDEGCAMCTAGTDELSAGLLEHLHARDTTYAMVSLAPFAKLQRYQRARGWDVPWYSSSGTDFNADFGVTVDPVASPSYNYRSVAEHRERGVDFGSEASEMPGRSCFVQDDGRVFHTYSQYARGLEATGGSPFFLDLTVLGRQEEWEQAVTVS